MNNTLDDCVDTIIEILICYVRNHANNHRVITIPGKDMYSDILTLIANIVNEDNKSHTNQDKFIILSAEGGTYVFEDGYPHVLTTEEHPKHFYIYPFLDTALLKYIDSTCDRISHDTLHMVYHRLFTL